jgi:hypothetical protein
MPLLELCIIKLQQPQCTSHSLWGIHNRHFSVSLFILSTQLIINFLAESYLQSLAAMNGLAAAAEQQSAQSPSSPNARPSNSATPNSANDESTTTNVEKSLSAGTEDAVRNNSMNAMFASAMQQFLQQQQYLNSANAWFGSQFLQKQLASPAGSAANAFVFPPPGLAAAFMPNASVASSIGDPLSADSTPTTNGSNNILSAFLAANPMKNDKSASESTNVEENNVEERQASITPTKKPEDLKVEKPAESTE